MSTRSASADTAEEMPRFDDVPSFLSFKQAAFALDTSPQQVGKLVRRGILKRVRFDKKSDGLITTESLRKLLLTMRVIQGAA